MTANVIQLYKQLAADRAYCFHIETSRPLTAEELERLRLILADGLLAASVVDRPVPEVLRNFGNVLMTKLTSPPLLSLYRLVVGEADRFPHLAETFYDRGPRRGKARAAEWVAEKMVRGEIRMGDPMRAVQHFSGLCQSGVYQFALLGMREAGDIDRLAEEVDLAVEHFCRAWCPPAPE